MKKLRVAVLMGGLSSERDISLSTGRMILEALNRDKYDVVAVDAARITGSMTPALKGSDTQVAAVAEAERALAKFGPLKSISEVAADEHLRPDVAFIALHGRYGEDGTIQGLLELLGIPYTGSGVLASALAMDKIMTKRLFRAEGIPVPPSVDLENRGELSSRDVRGEVSDLGYPVIVKPNRQGSTIGMTKVEHARDLLPAISKAFNYDSKVLVEKFVKGVEITIGLLGNTEPEILPVVEIVPMKGFYDYEAKYTPGATDEICPARIPDGAAEDARKIALASHKSLGCRGMSRVDMIVADSEIYVLEVNTIPGMTPTSLLPTAAKAAGIEFPELLDKLIELALENKDN